MSINCINTYPLHCTLYTVQDSLMCVHAHCTRHTAHCSLKESMPLRRQAP